MSRSSFFLLEAVKRGCRTPVLCAAGATAAHAPLGSGSADEAVQKKASVRLAVLCRGHTCSGEQHAINPPPPRSFISRTRAWYGSVFPHFAVGGETSPGNFLPHLAARDGQVDGTVDPRWRASLLPLQQKGHVRTLNFTTMLAGLSLRTLTVGAGRENKNILLCPPAEFFFFFRVS